MQMRKVVTRNFHTGLLCFGLLAAAGLPGGYAQQQAPPPATPPAQAPVRTPVEEVSNTGDGALAIELDGWYAPAFQPLLRTGRANANTNPTDLDFQKRTAGLPGGMLSIPVGTNNTLRFSYFEAQRAGDSIAPRDLNVFSNEYTAGTDVSTTYRLRNLKISMDFLTWPYPPKSRKFRLKTLWEIQYTSILASALGESVASDGTVTPLFGSQTRSIVYPTFGLAANYAASRHFRWEGSASGFAFPRHSTIWDAHTAAAIRFGPVEVLVGAKAFHFKTSPKNEQYFRGTLVGPYIGLRYYP
jgi:hypothetical protein